MIDLGFIDIICKRSKDCRQYYGNDKVGEYIRKIPSKKNERNNGYDQEYNGPLYHSSRKLRTKRENIKIKPLKKSRA